MLLTWRAKLELETASGSTYRQQQAPYWIEYQKTGLSNNRKIAIESTTNAVMPIVADLWARFATRDGAVRIDALVPRQLFYCSIHVLGSYTNKVVSWNRSRIILYVPAHLYCHLRTAVFPTYSIQYEHYQEFPCLRMRAEVCWERKWQMVNEYSICLPLVTLPKSLKWCGDVLGYCTLIRYRKGFERAFEISNWV